jgi:hypothetical protein
VSILQYYLIDEVPGQYRQYVDSTGRPWRLNYSSRFTTYMPPELIADYEANVSKWRVDGPNSQNSWFDSVVKPVIEAFWNNTVGLAFNDAQKIYDSPNPIPRYAPAGQAFRIGDWVFVPDGAVDPRSGGVSNVIEGGAGEPEPTPVFEDEWEDETGGGEVVPAAPSAMSYGIRAVLSAAVGGLAAYIAYAVASEFLE